MADQRNPDVYLRYARLKANQLANNPGLQSMLNSGGLFPRAAMLGGALIPGVGEAMSEMGEGRPAGAAGALAGGGLGAVGAQKLAQATLGTVAKAPGVVGLIGKVGMAAAPVLGGMFGAGVGGDVAEYGKRALTGDPITGKTDLKNTLATQKQVLDFMRTAGQDDMNTYIAGMQQLQRSQIDMEVEAAKRLDPFIQKQLDQALVRQQALINTQGNTYAKLGTIATAGKLATGAQAERGATVRTMLSQNPYANAIISAPSINFG